MKTSFHGKSELNYYVCKWKSDSLCTIFDFESLTKYRLNLVGQFLGPECSGFYGDVSKVDEEREWKVSEILIKLLLNAGFWHRVRLSRTGWRVAPGKMVRPAPGLIDSTQC